MARYLKTAGGNWNTSSTWSATGSGGVDNAGVPTSSDNVILELLSGQLTIDANAVCRSLDTTSGTGSYAGTITHNSGISLTIGGTVAGTGNVALKFNSGITYTLGSATTSSLSFVSSSSTQQTLDFAGKTIGNISFNSVSNNYQLASDVTTTGNWTYTLGTTFDANGKTITCSLTNATFTGGGKTYYGVTLTGAGQVDIIDTNTFTNLNRTGTATKTNSLSLQANQTVTGILTLAGNSAINRLLVYSSIYGTARTITNSGATMTLSNVDFRDITLGTSYNASAITGNSGDAGGNSGITFTTGATQTWSGTSGGNWSANAWTSRVPLPQDDVVISSAFSASQTVTADMPRLGKSINWTGSTGTPTFDFGSSIPYIFGSLTLISGMSLIPGSGPALAGRGSFTLTSAGQSFNQINIIPFGGTITLQDAFSSTSGSVFISYGTFNSNNFSVTIAKLGAAVTLGVRTITMGSSTWTLTGTGTVWDTTTTANLTLNANTSIITITDTSTSTKTFAGGGLTYNNFTLPANGGSVTISGSNTFNVFTINGPKQVLFTAGTTQTVSEFYAVGTGSGLLNGTGGTITDIIVNGLTYRVHTFTSSGTWGKPTSVTTVECLVVAGGGGGGGGDAFINAGGGGGAGGYLSDNSHSVSSSTYSITVGAGGASNTNGSNSVFDNLTAIGGGRGGFEANGSNGGSAGGGSGWFTTPIMTGGTGTVGQGNNGGSGTSTRGGGGGGGASAVGANANASNGGNGGTGTASSISGASVTRAGGGGGGSISGNIAGTGGTGGGGNGSATGAGSAGTANTGGGGGGGKGDNSGNAGGAGGSGTVIIRHPTNLIALMSTSNGSFWNIVKTSGFVTSDYLYLQDSHASGGASFYAGSHSTDVSGNTGWIFTDLTKSPSVFSLTLALQTSVRKALYNGTVFSLSLTLRTVSKAINYLLSVFSLVLGLQTSVRKAIYSATAFSLLLSLQTSVRKVIYSATVFALSLILRTISKTVTYSVSVFSLLLALQTSIRKILYYSTVFTLALLLRTISKTISYLLNTFGLILGLNNLALFIYKSVSFLSCSLALQTSVRQVSLIASKFDLLLSLKNPFSEFSKLVSTLNLTLDLKTVIPTAIKNINSFELVFTLNAILKNISKIISSFSLNLILYSIEKSLIFIASSFSLVLRLFHNTFTGITIKKAIHKKLNKILRIHKKFMKELRIRINRK